MADLTLVLEASTPTGSVALVAGGDVLAETRVQMRARDGEPLLPAAVTTLRTAGCSTADVGRIVCSSGPGGFTGLRIAAAIGKGLAESLGVALWSVSSLALLSAGVRRGVGLVDIATAPGGAHEPGQSGDGSMGSAQRADRAVLAHAAMSGGSGEAAGVVGDGAILAILDAMRDEWYVQHLAWRARADIAPVSDVQRLARPELEALAARTGATVAGVGGASFTGGLEAIPLARDLVALAEGSLLHPVDLASWEPEYGRLAEAQVKWEAAHGRALGSVG